MEKLILIDEVQPTEIINDGKHYYPISNCLNLDDILEYIVSQIPQLDSDEFQQSLSIVGSWNKKSPGSVHKDLDFILPTTCLNDYLQLLENLKVTYYFYKGIATLTMIIKDQFNIPRKVDIFFVDKVEFSKKAYEVPNYDETEWPSFMRNMLLNSICKIKFISNDKKYTGRFIPYKGICMYDETRDNYLLLNYWDILVDHLQFESLDKVEDLLRGIKKKWCDRTKDKLLTLVIQDRKLMNLLNENNKTLKDIEDKIF